MIWLVCKQLTRTRQKKACLQMQIKNQLQKRAIFVTIEKTSTVRYGR